MYKVTYDGKPFTVKFPKLKIGDHVDFKIVTPEGKLLELAKIPGQKVVSVFPTIDTPYCDEQTRKISQLAVQYDNIKFISVSLDLPAAQKRWCAVNNATNILIGSDYMERDFGKDCGFLIDEMKLLNRGIMLLDENNNVQYIDYNSEVQSQVNFPALEELLSAQHA